MADPTTEAPAWLSWLLGTGGAAAMAYQGYLFVSSKLKASTEEARAERKAARAEAVENDIIASLEKQVERMQAQIDRLTKHVAEQDEKIEELNKLLGDAMNARVQAMLEATKVSEHNAQIEARLAVVGAERNSLCAAHAELANWLVGLDLPEGARLSPIYRKAVIWLEHHLARLSDQAA